MTTSQPGPLRSIAIVGGGTAGWMAATYLSRTIGEHVSITLVESNQIGTVGVGEATIPPICDFIRLLGVDEDDFIARTHATFKFGIEFVNWGSIGDRYIHPFGKHGFDMHGIAFHHYWLRSVRQGNDRPLEDYSLQAKAARAGKFTRPLDIPHSPLSQIAYALHFDARLVAKYLREYSENAGVRRIEGLVESVHRDGGSGDIAFIALADGTQVEADFFIDCTGFRSLLLGETLGTDYEDWSHWLPCNRVVAVPCEADGPPLPYTRATAHGAGWQWRIALQNRIGNGHVYCSEHMGEDEATAILLANLDGEPLADPRPLRFTTGRREVFWSRNCLALGLAAGFMEPLESTSIHLVQTGLARLMAFLPTRVHDPVRVAEYNRRTAREYAFIRDFLVLHYSATTRGDTPFWNFCRTRPLPESLADRLAIWRATGHAVFDPEELFNASNWAAVLTGQGIEAQQHHPVADMLAPTELDRRMQTMLRTIDASVDHMPTHTDYIAQHCARR